MVSRTPQPQGLRGSLRWIQLAVNDRWPSLERPLLERLGVKDIEWRSPLRDDAYAEYRDEEFLILLGLERLAPALREFWPRRGPQWDALGVSTAGDVLLVEAKAHVGEMCSPGTSASERSRQLIEKRLEACASKLGAATRKASWADHFYQLANRLAHLQFLRDHGVSAHLILVNFLNDDEMGGPTSPEVWQAAYDVAYSVMGLSRRHPLARYVIEIFPDIARE